MIVAERMDRIFVFVASPGDLNDERQKFHEAILEINRLKAEHLGLQLVPLGWEDTLPGRGRPQELINREIESCDLFVLLLWKRWGTPTGKYSSGTEEEFELARRLSEGAKDKPAIWLYFKKVPDDMMADPGSQLKQVLKFRTRIEEERAFLYCPFDTTDVWARVFKEHLAKWIDKQQPFETPARQIVLSSAQTERVELSAVQTDDGTAQKKLSNAATLLRLRALEATRAGRFTDAEMFFASSLATYEDLETLNSYGQFLDGLGELSRAQQLFDRLVDLAEIANNKNLLATAYANLGHICAKRSDMKTASKYWALASESAGIVLIGEPEKLVEFYSVFISYSLRDQEFADRLFADLQREGVRCWFAPHHVQAGKKLHEQIDSAIRLHERLLLILSPNSINNEWVKTEIAKALGREVSEGTRVLYPIRLNISYEELQTWECFDANRGKDSAREIREYYIPDFTEWKDHDHYQQEFKKLLRDLKK
jgi:tetratricopeptide (TPR) repeat protein